MAQNIQTFQEGEVLVKENSISRKLFIIRQGKVRVFKQYFNQKITLAILGVGEVVGELSFFDANPRSASVEAITDLEVIVIDGSDDKQMEKIPSWVISVLKNTFKRFREMDQEITLLKSMYDFQKKSQKVDNVGKTLYLEILRSNKALSMLATQHEQKHPHEPFEWDRISSDIDNILGKKYINLNKYLQELVNIEMLTQQGKEPKYFLNHEKMDQFNEYIDQQIEREEYLLISQSALSILRAIIETTNNKVAEGEKQALNLQNFQVKNIPLYDEALKELSTLKIISLQSTGIILYKPEIIQRHYIYQSILKNFDHSILYSS